MSKPMTPEERAEKRFPASPQRHVWIIYEQQACATTIREEVEPLEAEVEKLRALVQGMLDLSFHDSECHSSVWEGSCDCIKRIIDERAKEAGFTPTNTEDNG